MSWLRYLLATLARRLRIGWPRQYRALLNQGTHTVTGQDVALTYTPAADTTPNAFTFTDQTGVATSTVITSAAITISGLSTGTSITLNASGGTIDKNGNANFLGSQIVQNGDTVRARVNSSASGGTATNCTVAASPSGVQDTFTATTTSGSSGSPQPGFTINVVGDQMTITRTGGGFGAKPYDPKPLLWVPCTSNASPSSLGRITTARTLEGLAFSATGGADGAGCLTGTGINGAGDNVWTLRVESDEWSGSTYDFNSYDLKRFWSRRINKNFGDLNSSYNVKDSRDWGRVGGIGSSIQTPSTYLARSLGRFGEEGLPNSPGLDFNMDATVRAAACGITNRWFDEEIQTKCNSAANATGSTPDALYYWAVDGGDWRLKPPYITYQQFYLRWKNATGDGGDGRIRITFPVHLVVDAGGGSRPALPSGQYSVDDIYFDDSWCRVVLGDSATYTSCTERRPCPPSVWNDGTIVVTIPSGVNHKNVHVVTNNYDLLYAGLRP